MRRSLPYLFVLTLIVLVPLAAHAATATSFVAIVNQQSCNCAAAWGCVLQTFQNLMNDAVYLGIVLITVYIAWAGVAYLMAPINAEGRQAAKTRLMNAVLGLLVMLGAWLLVNSLMVVIYAGNNSTNPNNFLPWNSILSSGNAGPCIVATSAPSSLPSLGSASSASGGTPSVVGPSSSAGDCSAANLTQTWGSQALGNTFSCIINNESKCENILNKPVGGQMSSAGGRYQDLITSGYANQPPFVSQEPACVAIDNGINCDLYFHGGASDGSANANLCDQALLDPTCNTQIAQAVYKLSGNKFSSENWLGVGDIGGKNAACVAQYDHS